MKLRGLFLLLVVPVVGVWPVAAAAQLTCPTGFTPQTIDFDTDAFLNPLAEGAVIDNDANPAVAAAPQPYSAFGLTIELAASNCYPGPLMIFDADGVPPSGGDADLGSPNQNCMPAGPGVGAAGGPGEQFENCVNQGNILIVSEDGDSSDPDDCGGGTQTVRMIWSYSTTVGSLGTLDVDTQADRPTLEFYANPGDVVPLGTTRVGPTDPDCPGAFPACPFGDNSHVVQTGLETFFPQMFRRLDFVFDSSGSISTFEFCRDDNFIPVTLSSFEATPHGDRVTFEWSTATELGNAGFHIFADTAEGWKRVNERLIPSLIVDSVEPRRYSLEAAGLGAQRFVLVDVDVRGKERLHGPFDLGGSHGGGSALPRPVDWQSIRAARPGNPPPAEHRAATGRGLDRRTRFGLRSDRQGLNLLVDRDGVHRVTYEEMLAAGKDLLGAPADRIGLLNRGEPVPILVEGGPTFGPGSAIEFHGRALDTLYTTTNVYRLSLDRRNARRTDLDLRFPDPLQPPPEFYWETTEVERNREYSFASPNGDPWYDTRILAYTEPQTESFDVEIDHLASLDDGATLGVEMWGVTDWPQSPDHHVEVAFNSTPLVDEMFDGLVDHPLEISLPPGVLRDGTNTLELTVVGDLGTEWDIVTFDRFWLRFPRLFVAGDEGLRFQGSAPVFRVDGLPAPELRVYRLGSGGVARLEGVQVTPSASGFSALLPGSEDSFEYVVTPLGSIRKPGLQLVESRSRIPRGRADLLIIAHPDFLDGLAPLVTTHRSAGHRVRLVDLRDVYALFSHGIVDPEAIRAYIREARVSLGVESVLLVGGDTYDYHDYLGVGAQSFLPTPYSPTGPIVRYAPADPLYADVDEDGAPDLAIGRLPVRTPEELDRLIEKTLQYAGKSYPRTGLFAADAADAAISFSGSSNELIAALPEGWSVERSYLDESDLDAARRRVLDSINGGVALAHYLGHSGPTSWSFSGLFTAADAVALENHGLPTVVTQWGCWNTYSVSPTYESLASELLLAGEQGAAAVLGATTLTLAESELALARLLIPKLAQPGMTIGRALLEAKQELERERPGLRDVQLGWTLLGDPLLQVE